MISIFIHDNFVIKKLFWEKAALTDSKDQKPPLLTELSLKLHQ